MKILLDTHIIIWTLTSSSMLSVKARELIMNEDNKVFFSIISLWEIEMKRQSKPENLPYNAKYFEDFCKKAGYILIGLKSEHISKLSELKRPDNVPPHKDPFDKMLICQSLSENMTFLTHDKLIGGYGLQNIIVV